MKNWILILALLLLLPIKLTKGDKLLDIGYFAYYDRVLYLKDSMINQYDRYNLVAREILSDLYLG